DIGIDAGRLRFRSSTGELMAPVDEWNIDLGWSAWLVVAAAAVWWLAVAACRLVVRLRSRRRTAAGRCVACGYQIDGSLTS
ncbi:MAG: hypothetical protein KDA22_04730, partial [Phycisphaerales bacterium]|nr:hypothetical protein [Phycisphaerales bacterium]